MGERTSYTPGTFSWVDLATTDQEAAKSFYGSLFGWEYDDRPMGEGAVYSMAQLDGKAVAAIAPQMQDQRDQGIPPNWTSYVTVESADDAARRAGELGGQVYAQPFEVFDAGRMAVIADPTGAVFAVWEPRENIGAYLVNVPGALTNNQLNTGDPDAATAFYEGLFGWDIAELESPGQPYFRIENRGRLNAGMMPVPPDQPMPSHWLVYLASADLDAHAAQIRELGGTLMVEPMPIPSGRILVAQDPQGAFFALFEGPMDD